LFAEQLEHSSCRQPVGQRGGLFICARIPQAVQQEGHGARVVEGSTGGCRKELAELNRPRRERKLRKGLGRPLNQAEREIFASDLLKDRLTDKAQTQNTRPGEEVPGG
jgi:hypothetical protein